jgi:hypothetical protein
MVSGMPRLSALALSLSTACCIAMIVKNVSRPRLSRPHDCLYSHGLMNIQDSQQHFMASDIQEHIIVICNSNIVYVRTL